MKCYKDCKYSKKCKETQEKYNLEDGEYHPETMSCFWSTDRELKDFKMEYKVGDKVKVFMSWQHLDPNKDEDKFYNTGIIEQIKNYRGSLTGVTKEYIIGWKCGQKTVHHNLCGHSEDEITDILPLHELSEKAKSSWMMQRQFCADIVCNAFGGK